MGEQIRVWVSQLNGRPNLSLQWYDSAGRRRTKSAGTGDSGLAEDMRRDLESDLNNRRYKESTGISWKRFRRVYRREYLAGLRERSKEKALTVFDVFQQICRPRRLQKITERTLSRFVRGMRRRVTQTGKVGLEPITQRNYLVCLKTALAWAKDQKLIADVPKFPKIKVPKKRPQPIPAESFEKLLAECRSQEWRAFMLAGWWAGLRLSEAKFLAWSKTKNRPYVSLAEDRIILPAEFVKVGEDQWVPLHAQLRAALESVPRDGKSGDAVFPTIWRLSRHAVVNRIGRMAARAGVRLSMHRLRKGFGCRVAQQLGKGDAPVLHRLMRHSSMQLTMDYYASADPVLHQKMEQLT